MLSRVSECLKHVNGNNDLFSLFGISFCTLHAFAAFSFTLLAGCIFVCFDMVQMKCRQKNKLNYLDPTPIFSTGELPNLNIKINLAVRRRDSLHTCVNITHHTSHYTRLFRFSLSLLHIIIIPPILIS